MVPGNKELTLTKMVQYTYHNKEVYSWGEVNFHLNLNAKSILKWSSIHFLLNDIGLRLLQIVMYLKPTAG